MSGAGQCDCFMEQMFGSVAMNRCQNEATWQGDNEDGCLVFACDDHRHLLAFGTMSPASESDEQVER